MRGDIRLSRSNDRVVVVATDIGYRHPGPSITNSYEVLARTLVREHQVPPEHTLWFEHYDNWEDGGALHRRGKHEDLDQVHLRWTGDDPTVLRWSPSSRTVFEELAGSRYRAKTAGPGPHPG